jgi:CP family cyanate transporter-like MFS transporter
MHAFVFAAIIVFAFNLRPALVTIGPLLPEVQRSLAMGGLGVGLLTALPVFALGGSSLFADRFGRRVGWGQAILVASIIVTLGIVLRSSGSVWAAFVGAVLLGLGVGLGGVYTPALLKARAGTRIGMWMGVYTSLLVGGSLFAVFTTPMLFRMLSNDWRLALGVWAIPSLLAVLLWLTLRRLDIPPNRAALHVDLWRNPTAWAVSANMATQSILFYSLASWFPTLLIARGMSVEASGTAMSCFFILQLPASLFMPIMATRMRGQGVLSAVLTAVAGGGILAALYGPLAWVPVDALVIGGSLGSVFALALSFLVLRTRSPQTAGGLSGMAQTVGYLIAAIGPLVLGALRTAPDARLASLVWLEVLVVAGVFAGLAAGRPRYVEAD